MVEGGIDPKQTDLSIISKASTAATARFHAPRSGDPPTNKANSNNKQANTVSIQHFIFFKKMIWVKNVLLYIQSVEKMHPIFA